MVTVDETVVKQSFSEFAWAAIAEDAFADARDIRPRPHNTRLISRLSPFLQLPRDIIRKTRRKPRKTC